MRARENCVKPMATALLLFTAPLGLDAADKRQITHETLWLMKSVGAPAASPDGKWVVFPVTEPAYDEKDEVSDLWIVAGDGSAPPRRLTSGRGTKTGTDWSPDSKKIAFSAKREGDEVSQIYILDLAGGEAQRLTSLTLGARAPKWSPDGKMLLFQSAVWRGARNEAENKKLNDERKIAKSKVRTYDGFPIRHWDRWLDERQTHLFVAPAEDGSKAKDLLAGTQMVQAPGFHGRGGEEQGGDDLAPAWSPGAQSIVFTASVDGDIAAWGEPTTQLYEAALSGAEPRPLTSGDITHSNAVFSRDGKSLCFKTVAGKGTIYALDRIGCATWPWTGSVTPVASTFDRGVRNLSFASDSRTLYFAADDAGHTRIYSAALSGGEAKLAFDAPRGVWRSMTLPALANPPAIFALWESAVVPAEVHRLDPRTGKQTRLTNFNTDQASAIDWLPLREFWFTSKEGRRIHSFLVLPPGFDEGKKYPLLVLIHGGHASMWSDSITRRWNYHLLTSPGYVGLLTDYRGSTGYGEKFTLDILGDPLRGPADDINAAADEAIRQFPFIDSSRQAAAGGSYGGHLVNWLEATTDRYRCLVSHAGLASLYAQWATSDGIRHRELMMGGPFWENTQKWLDQSPTTYAARFKTPLLLSVGDNDFRVPLNNTLEMWSVLQRRRVPGRLLVWPQANHWITNGHDSRRFYQEVHGWLARWLR